MAQILEQLGKDGLNGVIARGLHQVVSLCGAAKTLVRADSGSRIMLDQITGSILTLPTPEVGMMFKVGVLASVTSNSHIIQTADGATEFMLGGIQQMIDTTGVSEGQFADGATDITVTMNGTTTGGLIGTELTFEAVNDTQWVVTGLVASSGTLATPFTT